MAATLLPTPSGTVPVHVAIPYGRRDASGQAGGPWPGIILIHDALGVTGDTHRQAAWLVEAGYLVVTPDLFAWGGTLRCLFATFREIGSGRAGRAADAVEATRRWLAARSDCTGRIGLIGFCMGGGFVLLHASADRYAAASVNYGRIPADAATRFEAACPVVGSYGADDRTLRGATARLEALLTAAGVDHDLKEYPNAGHAFMNRHDPGEGPRLFLLAARLTGMGPNDDAAADARARITAFFDARLRVTT